MAVRGRHSRSSSVAGPACCAPPARRGAADRATTSPRAAARVGAGRCRCRCVGRRVASAGRHGLELVRAAGLSSAVTAADAAQPPPPPSTSRAVRKAERGRREPDSGAEHRPVFLSRLALSSVPATRYNDINVSARRKEGNRQTDSRDRGVWEEDAMVTASKK